ncbi:MAG: 30S ribosomal protein S21 [Oscillospiraceae bacterium]|jgi:small subunit ribosomal protein S21|nr:30S ribosomal protein S21 [Oscillospiraceae bacterium]
MSDVYLKDGESLDSALKRFKRAVSKAGTIADVRRHEFYQPPAVKRRKKQEAARKNRKKRG